MTNRGAHLRMRERFGYRVYVKNQLRMDLSESAFEKVSHTLARWNPVIPTTPI